MCCVEMVRDEETLVDELRGFRVVEFMGVWDGGGVWRGVGGGVKVLARRKGRGKMVSKFRYSREDDMRVGEGEHCTGIL